MLETLFMSPATMIAGGALISSPIIIHLINRMRFKRIRWAAMEFLLKSQKRNRRRLIIEQLILLLLRILLVLLAGFLLARFIGYAFGALKPQNTLHVIVLDDTPSMGDQWKDEGETKDSFTWAKSAIVEKIATKASQAHGAHAVVVLRLSSLDQPHRIGRLTAEEVQGLDKFLQDKEVSALHVDLIEGLRRAEMIFDEQPHDVRFLHVVSDFRQRDWSGSSAQGIDQTLKGLAQRQVKLRLVDVAHPDRGGQQAPAYHQNLAVIDLRPETRVAALFMPVQFSVTVANYGTGPRENVRLTVKVNGGERAEASLTMPSVPPGTSSPGNTATFNLFFVQKGFNQVTVNLENEEAGLRIDNTRYAVVDVRDQVPLLVIDGDIGRGLKDKGDTFHLQMVFDPFRGAAKGYDLRARGPAELEQDTLDQYPTIFLLNVRSLSDKAVANLENYLREGGGVAFFLGERVSPEFYNTRLYNDGKGLFPCPLADRPFPALSDDEFQPEFSPDQFQAFLHRDKYKHPIFASVSDFLAIYKVLTIKRYFPVPRGQWKRGPDTEELLTLPNRKTVDDYSGRASALLDRLPLADPRWEKYSPGLSEHARSIRNVLASGPLFRLANELEFLLRDQGETSDPKKPNLVEFWNQPEMAELRDEIARFRDVVQYGDPLMVAGKFGKGRVVACTTTAGQAWNDWAGGSIFAEALAANFVTVLIDLQKYLANAAGDVNYIVGQEVAIRDADAARYDRRMRRFFQPEPQADAAPGGDGKNSGLVDLGEQSPGQEKDNRLHFSFSEARKPGIYQFEFYPQESSDPTKARPEDQRALAFNVDCLAESDLRRSPGEALENVAPGVLVQTVEGSNFVEDTYHQADLSEMPWLYLLLLLILLAEQALAVHLSFHLKSGEVAQPAAAPVPAA
jgi:hypothetical protein